MAGKRSWLVLILITLVIAGCSPSPTEYARATAIVRESEVKATVAIRESEVKALATTRPIYARATVESASASLHEQSSFIEARTWQAVLIIGMIAFAVVVIATAFQLAKHMGGIVSIPREIMMKER